MFARIVRGYSDGPKSAGHSSAVCLTPAASINRPFLFPPIGVTPNVRVGHKHFGSTVLLTEDEVRAKKSGQQSVPDVINQREQSRVAFWAGPCLGEGGERRDGERTY